MTTDQLMERIAIDAAVCHGQPCIRGTRVLVTVILDALAAGLAAQQITEHYPTIDVDDVRAAAAYGAWLAKQEIHALSIAPCTSSSIRTSRQVDIGDI